MKRAEYKSFTLVEDAEMLSGANAYVLAPNGSMWDYFPSASMLLSTSTNSR